MIYSNFTGLGKVKVSKGSLIFRFLTEGTLSHFVRHGSIINLLFVNLY